MTKKIYLPETSKLWGEINAVLKSNASNQYNKTKMKIDLVKSRLEGAESMEEYRTINEEIAALDEKLQELEKEIRTLPIKEKEIRNNEMLKVPEVYNREFEPYYKEYIKLDEELKKQLKKFAKDVEPIVDEMRRIQQVENDYHRLKFDVSSVNGARCYLDLPVERKTLRRDVFQFNESIQNLAHHVKIIINEIKRKVNN